MHLTGAYRVMLHVLVRGSTSVDFPCLMLSFAAGVLVSVSYDDQNGCILTRKWRFFLGLVLWFCCKKGQA